MSCCATNVAELVHDGFVVGGDAAEDRTGDDALHQLDVVGVDVGLGGEGDLGGFLVGAFAEADADALGEEAFYIIFGAKEVGLEDGADGAGVLLVEALGELEGGLGVLGAFHVDADEAADVGGVGDHVGDDAFGEGGAFGGAADVHADLGELDGDVGAEAAGLDGVEELVVDGGAGFGVGDVEDGFAEGVEGDVDAFGVELGGGGDGLVDGHAGDEAAGDAAADGGALRERAEGLVGGETNEERTKQEVNLCGGRTTVSFSHLGVRGCWRGIRYSHKCAVLGGWRGSVWGGVGVLFEVGDLAVLEGDLPAVVVVDDLDAEVGFDLVQRTKQPNRFRTSHPWIFVGRGSPDTVRVGVLYDRIGGGSTNFD